MPNEETAVLKLLLICCAEGASISLPVPANAELMVVHGPHAAVRALLDSKWRAIFFDLDSDAEQMLAMASSVDGLSLAAGVNVPPVRIGISSSMRTRCGDAPDGLDVIVDGYTPIDWASWFSAPDSVQAPKNVVFDPEDLIDRMMGNEILARRIVGVFLEDTPRQLMALSDALQREDASLGSRIAHSIRGAASNAGGDAIVSMVREIECECIDGNLDQAKHRMPELEEQFKRLRPLLESFSN